jgi:hypothetical protein
VGLDEASGDSNVVLEEVRVDERWCRGAQNGAHLAVTTNVERIVLHHAAHPRHVGPQHLRQFSRRAQPMGAGRDENADDAGAQDL